MASDVLSGFGTRTTPQSRAARPDQAKNNAGGFVFTIDARARALRFLTIGVETGTYYVSAKDLTAENATSLLELVRTPSEAHWLVDAIVDISDAGRAPRNNEALFALALVAGCEHRDERVYALRNLARVARTGTHLFIFARYLEQFRGWGVAPRKAVGAWYTERSIGSLQNQVVKYRQREGWSHRDLLRLAHPDARNGAQKDVFDWVCGRETNTAGLPLIHAFVEVQDERTTTSRIVNLIQSEVGITWEMLPDRHINDPAVWRALIGSGLPITALIRQLPRMTRLGVLDGIPGKIVRGKLVDPGALKAGRVHPIKLLMALKTYATGQSDRGTSTWTPRADVIDALDAAFYAAYGAVTPIGKRTKLSLDVSGSMAGNSWGAAPSLLSPRLITAAMSLVTKATEGEDASINAFSRGMVPLDISPRQRLDDVLDTISGLPFDRTDCALPMLDALKRKEEIDTFVIYTDNETWFGSTHPFQALRKYRDAMGIDARLVVVATSATEFTIADPNDPGMLDVSGFDAAVPGLISGFARGEL